LAASCSDINERKTIKKYNGWVSRLSANEIIENRQGGKATISYASENGRKMNQVTLELSKEDYQEAWRAHGDWPEEHGVCLPYPSSRRAIGEARKVRMIPYGCTYLRMTEMPIVDQQP